MQNGMRIVAWDLSAADLTPEAVESPSLSAAGSYF